MVAAARGGTLTARGLTGNIYVTEVYISDVTAQPVRFDAGGGASAASPDFMTYPEPVIVTDLVVANGLTDTTKARIVANGAPTPSIIRWALQDVGIQNRPKMSIKLRAETRLSMLQIT